MDVNDEVGGELGDDAGEVSGFEGVDDGIVEILIVVYL